MRLINLIETVTWKTIPDWPKYEVSTDGRVRNSATLKELAQWKSHRNGGGFDLRVTLYNSGKKRGLRVHRLVAAAFIPNPNNFPEVDHNDRNTFNNDVSNLEWVTSAQNIQRRTQYGESMKLKQLTNPQEYKIYCDMDGVLSDFAAGVKKLFPEYTEQRYETDSTFRQEMWDRVNAHASQGGELWYTLDPLPDARQLWSYIKPHNPTMLTATGTKVKTAGDQKKRWVKEHLGNVPVILVPAAKDKHRYAAKNHILIDDKKKAIDPWIASGGIGILHTNAADTIEQLKRLGL